MEWPVKFGDVLEWLRSSPINQAIVVGAVVLLLVVVILLIRSRKSRVSRKPVTQGGLGRLLDSRTQEVLSCIERVTRPSIGSWTNIASIRSLISC